MGDLMTSAVNDIWQTQANCIGVDPDIFFPERGASLQPAKSVCFSCPVRTPCLEFALEHREKSGVWGGTSERERRRIIRHRQTLVVNTESPEL